MRLRLALLLCLCAALWTASPVAAATPDISGVIEGFLSKQFPRAHSHFWVVNGTDWPADNEVVVDFNAVVQQTLGQAPTETRFLLLIVRGKLAASQSIPLDSPAECQPDQHQT